MPYPPKPQFAYSYTGFQQSQGDNSFPGVSLDADLASVGLSLGELIDFIKTSLAEDGTLKTASVGRKHLASDLVLGLPAPRPWAAATDYNADDTATSGNGLYIALSYHTSSGSFAADLAAGKWAIVAQFEVSSTPADGSVTPAKLAVNAVGRVALDDDAVGPDELGADTVLPIHVAVGFGLVPVGAETDWAGIELPPRWLWENGAAVSRTTYALLFEALSKLVNGTLTLNSAVITGLAADLRGKGLEGAVVEAAGVPAGATITTVTATTLTLSANATTNAVGRQLRILPYGAGDGSTTFNVPDRRGRVTAGRDNMGGSAAARLTTALGGLDGNGLGKAGGSQNVTLTIGQLPNINPTGTVSVSYPAHTYNKPEFEAYASSAVPGGTGGFSGFVAASTSPPVTGQFSLNINSFGSGQAHFNVQPTGMTNKIIFAGV